MRVAEEHGRAGRDGDLLVLRELLALIPGQRPPQPRRNTLERVSDRLADPIGRRDAVSERQKDQIPDTRSQDGAGLIPLRRRKQVLSRVRARTSCSPCDARSHALSELLDWRSTNVS